MTVKTEILLIWRGKLKIPQAEIFLEIKCVLNVKSFSCRRIHENIVNLHLSVYWKVCNLLYIKIATSHSKYIVWKGRCDVFCPSSWTSKFQGSEGELSSKIGFRNRCQLYCMQYSATVIPLNTIHFLVPYFTPSIFLFLSHYLILS